MTTALDAAETKAVEARRVADAFSEQVKRRRRRWENTLAANDSTNADLNAAWADYQHAIVQSRAASQSARAAESHWANILDAGHVR